MMLSIKNIAIILLLLITLIGCSSGGGSVENKQVSGIAATGAAAANTAVFLSDANNVVVSVFTGDDGSFLFDVTDLQAPYLMWFVKGDYKFYSVSFVAGTANINPFTDAVTRAAYVDAGGEGEPIAIKMIEENCNACEIKLKKIMQAIFDLYGIDIDISVITQEGFSADGKGLDGMFDDFNIEVVNNILIISSKIDGVSIIEIPMDDISETEDKITEDELSEEMVIRMLNNVLEDIIFDSFKGDNIEPDSIHFDLSFYSTAANETSLTWVSSNESMVDINGKVNRTLENMPITITLNISKNGYSVQKEFHITILKITDAESVEFDTDEMIFDSIKNTNNSISNILTDLNLMVTGDYDTTIIWESTNTTVIDSSGIVARPTYLNGDSEVTLTATISKGSESETVVFSVVVIKLPITDAESVMVDTSDLIFNIIKKLNIEEGDIQTDLDLIVSSSNGTNVSWTSSDIAISTSGIVTRAAYLTGDTSVSLSATVSKGSESDNVIFNLTVTKLPITDAESVLVDTGDLVFDIIKNLNSAEGDIQTDLDLIVSGNNGTNISWASSDVAISTSGVVTRAVYLTGDTSVSLLATLSKGSVSDDVRFNLVVTKLPISDAESVMIDTQDLVFDNIRSFNKTENTIIFDIDVMSAGANGTTIIWESSNDAYLDGSGNITRATVTAGDQNIQYTATIRKGVVSDTKIFNLTVLSIIPKPISAGDYHSVLIKENGDLYSTGLNDDGQLGIDSLETSASYVQEASNNDWIFVSAGKKHTCAITTGGELWCWGDNEYGQLGNGSFDTSNIPVQENRHDTDWISVSSGFMHTVALKANGEIWGWGSNGSKQLRENLEADRSNVPVQESSEANNWTKVSASFYGSFGINMDGELWGWGTVSYGGPDNIRYNVPTEFRPSYKWLMISGGLDASIAVTSTGQLRAWGDNYFAQLGTGHINTGYTYPISVSSDFTDWAAIATGVSGGSALRSNGEIWSWGNNSRGDIGDGSVTQRTRPVRESTHSSDWTDIAKGRYHTMALKSNGEVWSWGTNQNGEQGNGDIYSDTLRKPTLNRDKEYIEIAAGLSYSCGIDSGHRLWCVGRNDDGQLGNNSIEDTIVPVQENSMSTDWKIVRAGTFHTVAIKNDGTLWGWGDNEYGQLGVGRDTHRIRVPTQESTMSTDWIDVSVSSPNIKSSSYTLGLKSNGEVWGWGSSFNQLCIEKVGSSDYKKVPIKISADSTSWKAISAGNYHSMFIKDDNTLWGCGYNSDGKLGIGSTTVTSTITEVSGGGYWAAVDAGYNHSMGLKQDGSLWTWGRNSDSELCDGTQEDRDVPVKISENGDSWSKISTRRYSSSAIKSDGTLWSCGKNNYGQLGINNSVDYFESATLVQEITGSTNWDKISSTWNTSITLKIDGSFHGWGDNSKSSVLPLAVINPTFVMDR